MSATPKPLSHEGLAPEATLRSTRASSTRCTVTSFDSIRSSSTISGGRSMLHAAGSRSYPVGNGSSSGPSHAAAHSDSQQRRLPIEAHVEAASYQLDTPTGCAPASLGYS